MGSILKKSVGIIGGGASGFFAAINLKEQFPDIEVEIFEKTSKLLTKVKVSGGGRCNVTHACYVPKDLVKNYPRGERELKSVFSKFQPGDVIAWFSKRGVELKTEEDGRMFPVSNSSQTIIDCFLDEAKRLGIKINQNYSLNSFSKEDDKITICFTNEETRSFDAILLASGGGNKRSNFEPIENSGHNIKGPLPSLFTFNIKDSDLHDLKGLSFKNIAIRIEGSKMEEVGDMLITHWGISGPAVLKLSAFGAEWIADKEYTFNISLNWYGHKEEECRKELTSIKNSGSKSLVFNELPVELPMRIKKFLLQRAGIEEERWIDLPKKKLNKLVEELTNCRFKVEGKTTFKEEFVTCGGVSLKDIDLRTMESKSIENLYFAGEVIDVDGITGGFNFQNAWSTAFIASGAIGNNLTKE